MHFYQHERTALFIDGPNLHATSKSLGFEVDYKRLLDFFRDKARLIRAFYYTVVAGDQEYSSIKPLIDWLDYNGYTLVSKPVREFTETGGRRKLKGSMNVELAVDALLHAGALDHLILFTGERDFRTLVAALQEAGKRVTLVSTLATTPAFVADELRRQADQFVDLADLQSLISRSAR
jgi:uncharacterized LabA/DUF88 family protein